MKLRIFLLPILATFFCQSLFAQENKPLESKLTIEFSDNHGCGSGLVESQTYGWWMGKVTKILSSNRFVLNKRFAVTLVGINPKINKTAIKDFLKNNLLGKNISFSANLRKESDLKLNAVVVIRDYDEVREINEYLLEHGLAKFKDFDTDYLVPYYWPCRLEKAQERAKQAKLGVWSNK